MESLNKEILEKILKGLNKTGRVEVVVEKGKPQVVEIKRKLVD